MYITTDLFSICYYIKVPTILPVTIINIHSISSYYNRVPTISQTSNVVYFVLPDKTLSVQDVYRD